MSGLELYEQRLAALIANLSPKAQKQLAGNIARKLRASQQQNIKRQQAPDGTPYKPRKAQPVRGKKGRIKREMFAKLRTAKYMKASSTGGNAVVEFTGRVQRMARVHHYGLRDRPGRTSKELKYEARPLLGVSNSEISIVQDAIIESLRG